MPPNKNAKKETQQRSNEHPQEHSLREILEEMLGFSGMELRQELWRYGHDIYPFVMSLMLGGHKPMPPDLEATLRLIAAQHLAGGPRSQEQADQYIEWLLSDDEDDESF